MATIYFPKTILQGPGSLEELAVAAINLQVNHLFVILSKRADREKRLIDKLADRSALKVSYFMDYTGEPTTSHIRLAIDQLHASGADCVVALGGGTPIDLAKAVAVLGKNKERTIKDIQGHENLERYPLIVIPTTAGTGSEATKISVITDPETSVKYNPAHPIFIPDIAILDAKLLKSLPKEVIAYCGMDALAHAMEAYVSTKANPISDMFAIESMKLIRTYLLQCHQEQDNIEALDGMLCASFYAGIAFSNASTNLAHATGRPLGARFNLPHGLSVALSLPEVIAFGKEAVHKRYKEIAKALGTEDVEQFIRTYNKNLQIYEIARKYLDSNKIMKAISILTSDALSGNGILTNVKIPTEQDVMNVYKAIGTELQEA